VGNWFLHSNAEMRQAALGLGVVPVTPVTLRRLPCG